MKKIYTFTLTLKQECLEKEDVLLRYQELSGLRRVLKLTPKFARLFDNLEREYFNKLHICDYYETE